MEQKHLVQAREQFREDLTERQVHVLDIPDDYRFMDPELIEILGETVGAALKKSSP